MTPKKPDARRFTDDDIDFLIRLVDLGKGTATISRGLAMRLIARIHAAESEGRQAYKEVHKAGLAEADQTAHYRHNLNEICLKCFAKGKNAGMEEAAKICEIRSQLKEANECNCGGYIRSAKHCAHVIRSSK